MIQRSPVHVLSRRRMISLAVIALSVGITAAMSVLFHGEVRPQMLATGLVCAIVIDRIVVRLTRHYRRQLELAHASLERRVAERTAELESANRALRTAATEQTSLRDELLARDRMATAGTLAASVSHEIRSPLSVIRIAVDEVQDLLGPDTDPDVHGMIRDISDATDRITLILRDLSSLARPGGDPLEPVELNEVIESAARLASYRVGKGAVIARPAVDELRVIGSSPRLVQLILNLLVNAARATRPDAPNTIRVGAVARGDSVIIAVSDTGTGMSEATKARLFEPFFTTGSSSGGTGLGLVICRSIVERMGGSIAIASTLGTGTTVEVTLQRAP